MKRIVISHHNADLDALASMVAATHLFEDTVAVGGSLVSPPVKRFLALHKDHFPIVSFKNVDPEAVEEVIVVDVRDRRRLKEFKDLLGAASRVVTWDHHPDGEHDIEADENIVEPVGACVTLLVQRLLEKGHEIEPAEATLYLLGIYSDTGRLSFSTTRPIDVEMAAELLKRGASLKVVNRYLRRQYTKEQSELLVSLMSSSHEISVDSVEVAFCTAEAPKFVRGASSVVQQVLELGGHDAVFGVLHFEKNDRVQIIARSRVSYLDVGNVMAKFGGGGHRGAAAATVKDRALDDVVDELKQILRDVPMLPTRVEAMMSTPVHTVDHDEDMSAVLAKFDEWGITGAPVMRDGNLVGVISRRDLERAENADKLELPAGSHMTHEVRTIDYREPVEDTLEMMTAEDIGRLPVTRDGKIVGIITRTDLLRELYMKTRDDSDLEI